MIDTEQIRVLLILLGFTLLGDAIGSYALDTRPAREILIYEIIRLLRASTGTFLIYIAYWLR